MPLVVKRLQNLSSGSTLPTTGAREKISQTPS